MQDYFYLRVINNYTGSLSLHIIKIQLQISKSFSLKYLRRERKIVISIGNNIMLQDIRNNNTSSWRLISTLLPEIITNDPVNTMLLMLMMMFAVLS